MNQTKIAELLRQLADAFEEGDAATPAPGARPKRRPPPKARPNYAVEVPASAQEIANEALRRKGYRV